MFTNPAPLSRTSGRAAALTATVALAFVLAACGGTSTKGSTATGDTTPAAAGDCGSVPTRAPQDPDGVLASLPQDVRDNYNLYGAPVLASAWAKWKPNHPAPYTVGILWQPPMNPFVSHTHDALVKTLEDSGEVAIVADLAPQGPTDVPGSLQQFGQIVAKKPDLIIAFPLAPEPFVEAINQAGAAGIPVVTPWSTVPSKYAVSVTANAALASANLSAQVLKAIGGKGSVLQVHGIPGITSDNDASIGFKAAMEGCPDVEVAGEVTGNFVSASAKGATLQFLSTHPAGVDGVLQAGVMTPGVIQAYEQLGKPVPPIADVGSTEGSLAYFAKNEDAVVASESTAEEGIGTSAARVALRMLHGDGPKTNQIVTLAKPITRDNLGDVAESDWDAASVASAWIPGDELFTDTELDAFFGTN